MEVGAVKQAFNNEVILLKKKLSQAKIQIIHKLTRKAKQLTEKKASDDLKVKLRRKAEYAVKEVLIIKKIKPKDLAKFIITHKGELKDYLNKPSVDNDKACARLLLHKVLQDKYKFIRGRFLDVSIQDLFMSRLERRKMKKEAKEKQKNIKKGNESNKVVNSEGDWDVEDIGNGGKTKLDSENDYESSNEDDDKFDKGESHSEDESHSQDANESQEGDKKQSDTEDADAYDDVNSSNGTESDSSEPKEKEINVTLKPTAKVRVSEDKFKQKEVIKKKPEKKQKALNKNKNFNEKIQHRKFKKETDTPVVSNKIVDPFFITSTGENYMSLVEPRAPDEIKDEHKQGNRKLRRAVMFGYVPKTKSRPVNNNYNDNKRFNSEHSFEKGNNNNSYRNQFNNSQEFSDKKYFNNNSDDSKRYNKVNDEKLEKLHPSWEAKKKKSGILPFEAHSQHLIL